MCGVNGNFLKCGCVQLVHGKPFEDMHVPNVSADLTIEDFINPPNSAESPDSLACLLPHAVHDVVSELANKLLRCERHSQLLPLKCQANLMTCECTRVNGSGIGG